MSFRPRRNTCQHAGAVPRTGTAVRQEDGIAVLIALIALSVFSILAMYMSLNATVEVRISDNYESRLQAGMAARAGLNHAREVVRGLVCNDLLKGPDGAYTNTSTYLNTGPDVCVPQPRGLGAGAFSEHRGSNGDLTGSSDDGLINTGLYNTTPGTVLIPALGAPFTPPNPYGSGTITTARYFTKVTDNNGEATELAVDGVNNPFFDGDHTIIVRSMGLARTITEVAGVVRRNSVAVVETRFRSGADI